MLTALTDLFDCPEDWTSRTRHGTSNKIIRPWLNLLSATTPESLANSLPSSAVGGGLTSRILFIWADKKKRPVTVPVLTQEEAHLKELMEKDLYVISRLSGEYTMSADCIKKWDEWYINYDEDEDGERACKDKSFSGWYSRKPTYIVKIAMIRAAAESDTMVVTWRHMEESIIAIQRVEEQMGNAFKAIGRSEISGDVDSVLQIIRTAKVISEKSLMSQIWKDVDNSKFDNVIETIIKTGKVQRLYEGPKGEKGIHYIYRGD